MEKLKSCDFEWCIKIVSSQFLYHIKVQYSEKATQFCKISTLLLSTVHTDKSKVEISQNFVAFSEYMNKFWTTQFFWVGHFDFFCFISMKISRRFLDIKNGLKFWWLPWFPAKNHSPQTFQPPVYSLFKTLKFYSNNTQHSGTGLQKY